MRVLQHGAFARPEQRRSRRLVVMRPGTVVSDGARRTRCLIVDVGIGGARLQLFSRPLPDDGLTLIDRGMKSVHELKVIWRRGPLVGVAFAGTAALP